MELENLNALFEATLNRETFRQAEFQLKEVEKQPGFLDGLLQLALSPSANPGIRRAAAVYLKNTVKGSWKNEIGDSDKLAFKEKIVHGVTEAGPHRDLILTTVSFIVTYELPDGNWPNLVAQINQLLSSSEAITVHAGLSLLSVLCRFFRFQSSEALVDLSEILQGLWPLVLAIAEASVSSDNSEARQMLYDFLKIVKFSTARVLPPVIQQPENCSRLVSILLLTLQRNSEEDDKCQKWASYNLLRIQIKYSGPRSHLGDQEKQYHAFRKMYKVHFTPRIATEVLQLLQMWAAGKNHLSGPVLYNLVSYISALVSIKSAFTIIQPYIEGLLGEVIYPLLCPSEEDVELFEEDPVEFVQKYVDIYQDAPNPANAAAKFLDSVSRKQREMFPVVVSFLESVVNGLKGHSDSQPIQKAGALRMFQALAHIFTSKNNPVIDQVETFVAQYVVDDLWASNGLLRFRALEALGAVAKQEEKSFSFKHRELLQKMYQGVIRCFYDTELPIQVSAALTLQALCGIPDIAAALSEHIAEIVQNLLALTKKVDLESLLSALDDFVSRYPEQITPFAVELAAQLRDQFLGIISEIMESGLGEDDELMMMNDDKVSAGFGILKSLLSLQMALENQSDIQLKLEEIISPIFLAVYRSRIQDFYTEALDLHDNTIFSVKAVSEQQWMLLDEMIKALEEGSFDYFEEAMSTLQDYVAFGGARLAADKHRLSLLVNLSLEVLKDSECTTVDTWSCALQLLVRILATPELQDGSLADVVPSILSGIIDRISEDHKRKMIQATPPRYPVNIVSVILAAIFTQPHVATRTLQAKGVVNDFMTLWFETSSRFTKVEDLKLVILCALSLVNLPLEENSPFFTYTQPILEFLAQALEALPGAVARRAEFEKNEAAEFDDDDDYAFEEDWNQRESDVDDDGDEFDESIQAERVGLPGEHLTSAAFGGQEGGSDLTTGDDADAATFFSNPSDFQYYMEEFQDDFGVDSPLMQVDAANVLQTVFRTLYETQPRYYQHILSKMSEKDKGIIQQSLEVNQASQIAHSPEQSSI